MSDTRRRRARKTARPGGTRFERRARTRRDSARSRRAFLRRSRTSGQSRDTTSLRRALAVGVFFTSLAAGLVVATQAPTAGRAWLGEQSLEIASVAVQGNVWLAPQAIAEASGVEPGTPLAAVEPALVEARLETHPWIRGARVALLPTGHLLVRVDEREARAVVLAPPSGNETARERWLVDGDGVPFARLAAPAAGVEPAAAVAAAGPPAAETPPAPSRWDTLPRLQSSSPLIAERADPVIARGIALADRATPLLAAAPFVGRKTLPFVGRETSAPLLLHLPRGEAAVASEGFVVTREDPPLALVLGSEGAEAGLERLALLADADAEGLNEALRGARRIDLRFADQAVLRSDIASR